MANLAYKILTADQWTQFQVKGIFAGAPVTQSNAIDQLEGIADKVPSHHINRDLVMLVEPSVAKFYNRDYRGTFGMNTSNTGGFTHTTLDGTNITITPEPGLADTGGIIVTPRENLVWMTGPLGGVPGCRSSWRRVSATSTSWPTSRRLRTSPSRSTCGATMRP